MAGSKRPNFFKDNADLQYYFEKGIDWLPIVEAVERGYRDPEGFKNAEEALEFYRDILEMVGGFVAKEIAPHSAAIDREGMELVDGDVVFGPTLVKIFKKINRLGLHGLAVPRELGGMNCPMLVYMMNGEMFSRADVSVMAHHSFHGGMAAAMLFYDMRDGAATIDPQTLTITDTRLREQIQEIIDGKAWGSMDLTEPDAGSDLAALRTRGVLGDDGVWRITGQKVFITSGHAKYHFVLARTEESSGEGLDGLDGLSLFLVKAFDQKTGERFATFDRLEEKLGHHGSATVSVTFDESPGLLLGQRGEGFKLMLLIMNNARLGVAFESLGLCESARRMAQAYAAERPSMGKTIDRHEMIADYLESMETDTQALRALAMYGAWHEELAQRYQIALEHLPEDDPERARLPDLIKHHKRRVRRVTPLCKYFGAEKSVEMARQCVQIHGGVGYTTEYGAEQLLRDAMVMPIYEGTSQIQSLMAMKDALSRIMKNPQAFIRRVAQARWRGVSARDPLEKRVAKLQTYAMSAQQHLIQRTATDKLRGLGGTPMSTWPKAFLQNWDPKRDFAFAMLHAERLTQILIDEVVAEILWKQARMHPERRELLERWLEKAEPRSRYLLEVITTTGDRLLDKLAEADKDQATA